MLGYFIPIQFLFLFLTEMITIFLKFFKPSLNFHCQKMDFWSYWNKMGLLKFSPSIHHTKLCLYQFLLRLVPCKKMIFHLLPSLLWLCPIIDSLFLEHLPFLWTDAFSSDFDCTSHSLVTQNYTNNLKEEKNTLTLRLFVHKFRFLLFITNLFKNIKFTHCCPPQSLRRSSMYRSLNLPLCWNCSQWSRILPQLQHLMIFSQNLYFWHVQKL